MHVPMLLDILELGAHEIENNMYGFALIYVCTRKFVNAPDMSMCMCICVCDLCTQIGIYSHA